MAKTMNESADIRAEVLDFIEKVGRTLQSHAVALNRHEEDVHGCFRACKSHHESLECLHAVVARQNELIAMLQAATLRLCAAVGIEPPPELPPPTLN